MAVERGTATPVGPGADSDLARLIALEQELTGRLERAREENAQLVARARSEAESAAVALADELEGLSRALGEEAREQARSRIADLEAAGAGKVRRQDALGDDVVEGLAAAVFAWLRGDEEEAG